MDDNNGSNSVKITDLVVHLSAINVSFRFITAACSIPRNLVFETSLVCMLQAYKTDMQPSPFVFEEVHCMTAGDLRQECRTGLEQ